MTLSFRESRRGFLAVGGCAAVAAVVSPAMADWPGFRGGDRGSVAADVQLPDGFNDPEGKNIAWKVGLPGKGASSPIVVAGKVYVTAAGGVADSERDIKQDQMHVLCFDAASGKELWRRKLWATGRTLAHSQSGNAAPTPVSDGKRVFAFYSSNDLACFDLNGDLQWFRGLAYDYPKAGNDIGMSSSPVVIGDVVVVQCENQGDSFAAGVDVATGESRWRIPLDQDAAWCSPTAFKTEAGKDVALVMSNKRLLAVDPTNGKELWRHEAGCNTIPSPTVVGNTIYTPAGGLTALRIRGDSPNPEIAWTANELSPGSGSPVVRDGKIYVVNSGGVLSVGDLETGKRISQTRLKGGRFWATPVIAGDKLVVASFGEEGETQIVQLGGKEPKIVGSGKLGEPIQATPAVDGDGMFIRGNKHLWKVAAGK